MLLIIVKRDAVDAVAKSLNCALPKEVDEVVKCGRYALSIEYEEEGYVYLGVTLSDRWGEEDWYYDVPEELPSDAEEIFSRICDVAVFIAGATSPAVNPESGTTAFRTSRWVWARDIKLPRKAMRLAEWCALGVAALDRLYTDPSEVFANAEEVCGGKRIICKAWLKR